ncbi:hypothetical protein BX661DRAFT_81454 [Kickxella alabastrina]|uniref:uncharacterized protein n=1 Tax=Kickxella alabastrina TaxID=61397 RepID=UPI00221EAB55|nr:uncharacterized protein BX661DRAFT_81454 [Kickxella alabastrina]KAI7833044.1 hypothetical protein BX661DRAFT_81454 [Kickxella alabastrina]
MASLEALPQNLFNQIAIELEAADLTTLALASRRLHRLASCDELWIEKISADFGNRTTVIDLLADAGVNITELVTNNPKITPWQLPKDCQQADDSDSEMDESESESESDSYSYTGSGLRCYRDRFIKVFPTSSDELVNNTKRAEAILDETKQLLRAGPDAGIEMFAEAAYRLMLVQEYFPNSAECYYLWALICFMLNDFKPSLSLLEIGHIINSDFAPIKELTAEVRSIMDGAYGSGSDAPLLNASGSGPSPQLAKVLAIMFQRLDSDRDGVLSASELSNMVKITNGQSPSAATISQIVRAFGGQVQTKSGRKIAGWDLNSLINFYVAQTLDDPQETRGDLSKFGFNPRTLKAE